MTTPVHLPTLPREMWRARKTAPALLLAALVAHPATAASKLDPPELDQYLRWGPFRVRPRVQLTNLGYDDNVFLDPENRESDYVATLSPAIDGLVLFGHRAFMTFEEQLDYTAYASNSQLNYLDQRGTARLTVPLRGFGVYTDFTLNRVQERPADRDDIRPERREGRLATGLILEPGWRTQIELGVLLNDWSYSDPDSPGFEGSISQLLDRAETGTNIDVTYRVRGRTDLLLDLRRKDIDFDHGFALAGSTATRDSQEWQVLPGLRLNRGGALSGTLQLGWKRIDARDPRLPDFADSVGELDLRYRGKSPLSVSLGLQRTPAFSVFENNVYVLTSTADLRAVRFLNRFLGIEAGTAVGRLSFPGSPGAGSRVDDVFSYDAGVRLRLAENSLGRRIEYRVRFGRWRRDSTNNLVDNSRSIFSTDAIVGF